MVDTKLESENHEEIVSNNGRIEGVPEVDIKSDVSHDHQPFLDNQTSQGNNITSLDGNPMSSHVSALAMGTGTIITPTETTVNDDVDNTDSDSDYNYMFYYYSGSEANESDNEDSGSSSVNTPRSVLSSKLFSCCLYGDSSSDSDATTDVNNANGRVCVVAGCRMCMLYIMVPAGTSVCFRCGNSGLIHFDGSGQASSDPQ